MPFDMRISFRPSALALNIFTAIRGLGLRCFVSPRPDSVKALKIIDFSYSRGGGHHHALNRLLVDSAASKGVETTILASRYIEPELWAQGALPVFRAGVYDAVGTLPEFQRKADHILDATTLDLLLQPLSTWRNPSTTLLIHTATPWHILALVRVMAACKATCQAQVFLMLPPEFDVTPELAPLQAAAYLQAWQEARAAGLRINFWTENRPLASTYQAIGLRDVTFLCLPMGLPPLGPRQVLRPDTHWPVFVFIGDPRPDKGFAVVVEALALAKAQALEMVFRLRLTMMKPEHQARLDPLECPQLDLEVQPFFTDETYCAELANADAVLLPYDPLAYRVKNSNMVAESVCQGSPVIVPGGANALCDYAEAWAQPLHVTMPSYSGQGLLDAMQACVANLPSLRAAAQAAAPQARQERDPGTFIDRMLS
jgi:glycosyltransferase involved in cell wall biosynthesis